jgi:hypothetical protein
MENKRKINVNRPKLTPDELRSHKHFDGVWSAFQKMIKPFYRRPRFFRGVILAAVVAAVVFYELEHDLLEKDQISTITPYINPPVQAVDVAYEHFQMKAEKGASLIYQTGSKIQIPEFAFVDQQGKVVDGKVEVKYRQFHDATDVVLSGMPMHYDSSGVQYHFESAGMMEILAFKDGEPVYLNSSKSIQVKMASYRNGSQYRLYLLDTLQKNWSYRGQDEIHSIEAVLSEIKNQKICDTANTDRAIAQLEKELVALKKQVSEKEALKPVKPLKADESRFRFNIEVDQSEFPELSVYKGMYFEVKPENKNFDPKLSKFIWEDAQLTKSNGEEHYFLKLIKGKESYIFSVDPVFEGKEYELAKVEYDKRFEEYKLALNQKKEEEKNKQKTMEEVRKKLEVAEKERVKLMEMEGQIAEEKFRSGVEEWEKYQNELQKKREEALAKQAEKMANQGMVYRVFQVSGLGAWNCDQPKALPSGGIIAADFTDENGTKLELQKLILVDLDRNGYYTYYPDHFSKLQFNPKAVNVLVGITKDFQVAVYAKEKFQGIESSDKVQILQMKLLESNVSTEASMRDILGLEFTKRKIVT